MTDKNTLVASSEPVLVPTPHGTFAVSAYKFADGTEHMLATAVGADGRPSHLRRTGKTTWFGSTPNVPRATCWDPTAATAGPN